MNLTPEQAAKIFDLKEKMHADTVDLRRQMMVKHAEMAALWKAANPDQTAIQAKQKELNALRDQMQDKMTAFGLEAKKVCPGFNMRMGMGMGISDCGMGPGVGQGPGMGMGPGPDGVTGAGAVPPPPPPPPAK